MWVQLRKSNSLASRLCDMPRHASDRSEPACGASDLCHKVQLPSYLRILALVVVTAGCAPDANTTPGTNRASDGYVSLFDGRSFAGWEGNQDVFHIVDGAIVGGSLKSPVVRNEYLCSTQEYTDFELKLKFKVHGQGANAGIQIRSQRVPESNEMIGYQADLGDHWWGCLYCERRHRLLTGPPEADRAKIIKRDEWNQYTIRCLGRRIQLWINGHQTVDYTEPDESVPLTGVIGLQVHQGDPMEAWYRDIEIKTLGK